MQTERIQAQHPNAIHHALEIFTRGGVVAFPTDTVYGIGVPMRERTIERLFDIKSRDHAKAVAVLIADAEQLENVATEISDQVKKLAAKFWPGPLTLVVMRNPKTPWFLSKNDTIGVRVPDHAVTRALLAAAGPMAVTSANLSGGANTLTAGEVLSQLNGRIELVIDGGQTPGDQPSTVVDMTGKEPKILREGPVSEAEIRAALA
jgi:L-threonylcarbamoyladenylate synthase